MAGTGPGAKAWPPASRWGARWGGSRQTDGRTGCSWKKTTKGYGSRTGRLPFPRRGTHTAVVVGPGGPSPGSAGRLGAGSAEGEQQVRRLLPDEFTLPDPICFQTPEQDFERMQPISHGQRGEDTPRCAQRSAPINGERGRRTFQCLKIHIQMGDEGRHATLFRSEFPSA